MEFNVPQVRGTFEVDEEFGLVGQNLVIRRTDVVGPDWPSRNASNVL